MSPTRRRAWAVTKTGFGLAVIAFVGLHFANTLRKPELEISFAAMRFEYFLPAGLLYLISHTLWGTFWWQLLRDEDQVVSWGRAVQTYFISQFGKYVPGKAWVIVMRMAMLKPFGLSRRAAAVTGIFETLTSMGAGALLGVAALPATGLKLPPEADALPLFAMVAGVPLGAAILLKVAQFLVNARRGPDAPTLHAPSIRLFLRGLVQNSVGWCCLAVSLQFVIAGVRGEDFLLTREIFLADLAAVALSYVAGFVLFVSPGGLGAREFVLKMLIAARWAEANAEATGVVVALMLRLTWTVAEVLLAGTLWLVARRRMHDA